MPLRRRFDHHAPAMHHDVTPQEVERRGYRERQHHCGHDQPDHHRQSGHREHVVADVPAEDGVDYLERDSMAKPEQRDPRSRRRRPHQQTEQHGHRHRGAPQQQCHVHLGQSGTKAHNHRIGHHAALGEPEVGVHERSGCDSDYEAETDLRSERREEDGLEAECREPVPVGRQVDRRRHTGEENESGHQDADEHYSPSCHFTAILLVGYH